MRVRNIRRQMIGNTRVRGEQFVQRLEDRLMLAVQPVVSAITEPQTVAPASLIAQPLAMVTVNVTGTAQWTDWNGGKHGVPNAFVEIRSTAGNVLNTSPIATGLDGTFSGSFSFDPTGGPLMVFARIYARNAAADVKPLAGGATYSMDTTSVVASDATPITLATRVASNSVTAEESFSIMAAMYEALSYVGTLINIPQALPSQIDVRYPDTNVNGGSFFSPTSPPSIHIWKGMDASGNTLDNGLDWDAIEHEYGHYVMSKYGFAANVGAPHTFKQATPKPSGPGMAWNEGFATYFSISAQRWAGAQPYAENTADYGNTSYDCYSAASVHNALYYDLATGTGVSETDEASVGSILYHLSVGDQGITITDKTLFQDFIGATPEPTTLGAAWLVLAANSGGMKRSQMGHVFGLQTAAPVELTPMDGASISASMIPTFTWQKNGYNDFQIQFLSSDFSTVIDTTTDLGDVSTFTPSAGEWSTIFNGSSTVKWVVEGQNTTAPATPGSVADGVYTGMLSRYWSSAGTLNGPSIAIVLDVTGSMSNEIGAVETALDGFITALQAATALIPGSVAPTVDLTTFIDGPTEVISSNDLNAVKAAIDAQSAGGGGDCPEPSAPSLAFAGQEIGAGGTILLITDASSDAGTDLDGTIAALRAKGVTVNAFISGDCSESIEPMVATMATAAVADADMVGGVDPDAQAPRGSGASSGADSADSSAAVPGFTRTFSSDSNGAATLVSASANITPLDTGAAPGGGGEGAGNDEPTQGDITDAGQMMIDGNGNTTSTASRVTVDGASVSGVVGDTVQTPDGTSTTTNTDDFFVVNLTAGVAYNIPIQTTDFNTVIANLLDTDGTTQLQTLTTQTGDPGFSAGTIQFTPTATGDYFLDIQSSGSQATYTVRVSTDPIVGVTSSVSLFSTVSNTTGGTFFFDPNVASDPTSDQLTAYQSSIQNVMDSTFEPSVLTATPSQLPQGVTLNVTLAGRRTNWLQGHTTVSFSDSSVTVNSVVVNSPTALTVSVTIAAGANAGDFSDVTVSTQLGAKSETATGSNAVQIASAPSSATLLQVQPTTVARAQSLSVTILGTLTSWDATSTLSLGPGITVTSMNVVSATEITAQVQVDPAASLGFRVATVTTTDNSGLDTQDQAVLVASTSLASIASVASITPAQANLGQHVDIAVVGENTNFVNGTTTADFGAGVTVDSVTVVDATHATVTIDVLDSATAGFRNVTLTTGTETAALLDGFLVSPSIPIVLAGPASPLATPLPLEPAVSASFTVTLAAASNTATTVDFATSDGTAIAGTDYTASSGTLTIPAGQTVGTISVPVTAQSTTQLDRTFTVTLSNASGGTLIQTGQASVTIAGVTLTSRTFDAKTKLTYTDSTGQAVTVMLHGAGNGIAYFANGSADPADIAVAGSTLQTSLLVVAPKATPAPVGGFGIQGSLNSLSAGNTTIFGSSAVSGDVLKVTLGNNTGSGDRFQINGAGAPASFALGTADGLIIMSASALKTITARNWAAGALTAPSLTSLTITGNMGVTLTTTGLLGAVKAGQIGGGTWTVGGSLTSLTTTRGIAGLVANVTGNVGAVTAASFAGVLTAGGAIKSINSKTTIAGNIQAASIGSVSAGGAVSSAEIRATNSIGAVKVGSIADSVVFAGISIGVSTLPVTADLTNAASSILSFSTKVASGFSNTFIGAGTLKSVNIHGAVSSGAGGAAATHFTSLLFTQAGHKPVKFSNVKAGSVIPTLLGTDFVISEI